MTAITRRVGKASYSHAVSAKFSSAHPQAGELAPLFSGKCSDGLDRALSDYRDGWVLLVFLRHFT